MPAGEAGRGFAVVAGEVKNLATETASATTDIVNKVAAIQEETGLTAQAIDEISSVIKQISDIQATIAVAVEQQTASTAEITRGVAEVARSAGDITGGITAVAEAAGDTSAGASASSDTIGELGTLSAQLDGLILQFRIG